MTRENDTGEDWRKNALFVVLEEELKKLNGGSLGVIKSAVREWLEKNQSNPRINSRLLASVRGYLDEDNVPGALLGVLTTIKEPPINRSLGKTVRSLRSKIVAATSGEEGYLQRGKQSTVFALGRAAHKICEEAITCRNKSTLGSKDFNWQIEGGMVVGLVERTERKTTPHLDFSKDEFNEVGNGKTKLPRVIRFEYPIAAPLEGQNRVKWAIDVFSQSLVEIKDTLGFLPEKPYDVEQIFVNQRTLKALMESLGAGHFLFGVDHGLSMVDWNGNNGVLESKNVGEFPVLDWLAVMRKTLELINTNEGRNTEEGILTELFEGDIPISLINEDTEIREKVKGNKIDVIKLRWKHDLEKSGDVIWQVPLGVAVEEIIAGKFGSQELRYHRKAVVEGKTREVATRNSRSLFNLFLELYKLYGERIFTDLAVTIEDLKFPAGDGGWSEQFNPKNLPERKHVEQVSGYLLKVAIQLCRVEKWLRGQNSLQPENARDFTVNAKEVAEFIVKHGLSERIKGRILYQFPGLEVCKSVGLEPNESIYEQVNGVFNVAGGNGKNIRDKVFVLRALERVLEPKIKGLKVVERETKKLPNEMKDLCVEYDGGIYLCIEKLSTLLTERVVGIKNMVVLSDKKVQVLWIDGLLENISQLMIAVDDKGRYSISYNDGEKRVHFDGRLLSSVRMKGVSEKADNLGLLYTKDVWEKASEKFSWIDHISLQNLVVKVNGKDKIIFPDGSLRDIVRGKQVVCLWNPMSGGGWYLDPDLLKGAVETNAAHSDLWGFNELVDLVNGRYRKGSGVLCPMPSHPNTNQESMAAHWYGDNQRPHIVCFGECNTSIDLTVALGINRGSIKVEPVASGETIADFKPVSTGRQETFRKMMQLALAVEGASNVGAKYLINERGLDPKEDVGEFGYLPTELTRALVQLVRSGGFKEIRKRNRNLRLDLLEDVFQTYGINNETETVEAIRQIMDVLDTVPVDFSNLTTGALTEMERRGIIDRRLGGRLILPTYFVNPPRSGMDTFVRVNFTARGIVLEGEQLFEEGSPQHLKARISQPGKKLVNGLRLLDTPAGFWAMDWQKFLVNVGMKKEVIIFEGPMDAASFGRIRPDYKHNGFANIGYNFHHLFPFLGFLGIVGDKDSSDQGFCLGIERVYFANDWDSTGAKMYFERKNRLGVRFPKLEVLPVRTLLPPDISAVVPEYDPALYQEDGPLYKNKLDLNGLINKTAENIPILKIIRDKYAYKP